MIRRHPGATRTNTPFTDATLFLSHKEQQHRAARKRNFLLRDGRSSAAWRRLLAAQHGKQATRQTGDKAKEKRGQKKEGRHGKRGRPLPADPFVFPCIGSAGRTRTCDMVVNSHPLYQLSYRGSGCDRWAIGLAGSTPARPSGGI